MADSEVTLPDNSFVKLFTNKDGGAGTSVVEKLLADEPSDDEDIVDDIVDDDDSPSGGEEDDESSDEADESSETDDESTPDDDETDEFIIDDSDLIAVTVDGEQEEVPIGELKRNYSLSKAAASRLQQASDAQAAAHADATQMLERLALQGQIMKSALTSLDSELFRPVIAKPDEALRVSNPAEYLQVLDAYNADQKRINDAKTALNTKLNEVSSGYAEQRSKYAERAGATIAQAIPELQNPETAKAKMDELKATARSFGYTDAEIASALDPRMFILMDAASKYNAIVAKTKKAGGTKLDDDKGKQRVKRLRSGSAASRKVQARKSAQKQKAAVAKARKTGKPNDVAATLLME